MAVDLIGGVAATTDTTSANAASALGQDDFLRILMTQLTYQDPLKPLDNQQFIAQMAQFTALEQTRQINDKLDSLLSSQSVMQAFSLMGKSITYNSASGTANGTVTGVNFSNGQPLLTAQASGSQPVSQIKLSSLISIGS